MTSASVTIAQLLPSLAEIMNSDLRAKTYAADPVDFAPYSVPFQNPRPQLADEL